MNYKYGSRDTEKDKGVAQLQQKLKDKGYNIAVDGIYGTETQKAVTQYQAKNKLKVDGIAGNETLTSLGIASKAPVKPQTTTTATQPTTAQTANQKLTQLATGTSSALGDMIDNLFNQIINQKPFEYEPSADPTYNRYADIYARNAKLMSEDAMAQAAQLTGGYGSSYGQAVATQAYNAEMSKMNDIIPELRQQALAEHENERAKDIEALSLLLNERAYERGIYESDRTYEFDKDELEWRKDEADLGRQEAALSAGFKSWDEYVKAVGEGRTGEVEDFDQNFLDGAIAAYQDKGVEGLDAYFDVYGMQYSDAALTDLGERISLGYEQNEMFRNVPNMENIDGVEKYLRETSDGDALSLEDREFLDSLIEYDGTDKFDTPETYQRYLNYRLYQYLKNRKYK